MLGYAHFLYSQNIFDMILVLSLAQSSKMPLVACRNEVRRQQLASVRSRATNATALEYAAMFCKCCCIDAVIAALKLRLTFLEVWQFLMNYVSHLKIRIKTRVNKSSTALK